MDTPRGLNQQDAEKALRDLFQTAGPLSAPDHLDARIMARIAVTSPDLRVPERPLVPVTGWVAAVVAFLAMVVYAMSIPPAEGNGLVSEVLGNVPSFDLFQALSSLWGLTVMASGICLFVLDAMLTKGGRSRSEQRL